MAQQLQQSFPETQEMQGKSFCALHITLAAAG